MAEAQKPMTTRRRRALETRKRILESALALFKSKGFDGVSIDEITQAAGTSKGSFYTYFATKSGIIIEEFKLIDAFYERKLPSIRRPKTARAKLLAFTRYQLQYIHEQMGYQTLAILYANQLSVLDSEKFLTDTVRPLFRIPRDIIAEGQARGEIGPDRTAEELSMWMSRCMRGFFLDWGVSRGSIDLRAEGMRFFEKYVLAGIFRHAEPAETAAPAGRAAARRPDRTAGAAPRRQASRRPASAPKAAASKAAASKAAASKPPAPKAAASKARPARPAPARRPKSP